MSRLLRLTHRWVGLLMAVQIIAWMASGLYFSLVPIEQVRGEHLTRSAELISGREWATLAAPETIQSSLDKVLEQDWTLQSLKPWKISGELYWLASGHVNGKPFQRRVTADGSRVLEQLDEQMAREMAQNWLLDPLPVLDARLLTSADPGSEFRGRPLPIWRIRFESDNDLSLYLDPWSGELLARRTDTWRLFDFLWMLHIMDFDTRDDFNHPLLQLAAALGLVVALSGVVYWLFSSRWYRQRRLRQSKAFGNG